MYICDRPGLNARVFVFEGSGLFWTSRARQCTMRTTSAACLRRAFPVVNSCRRVRLAALEVSRRRGPAGPSSVCWSFRCWRHLARLWLRRRDRSDRKFCSPSDKDEVPPGGCTPIGVTASGEIVFPFTCKGFLERVRGPMEEPKPAAQAEKPAPAQKSEAAAPALAAVPAKTDPAVQPVEPDSSLTSSVGEQKQGDDGKKRRRGAKRPRRAEPDAVAGRNF